MIKSRGHDFECDFCGKTSVVPAQTPFSTAFRTIVVHEESVYQENKLRFEVCLSCWPIKTAKQKQSVLSSIKRDI